MYCRRVGFAHRDRNGGQSPPYLTCVVDFTWVPQLNTDLALILERQLIEISINTHRFESAFVQHAG